jgi:hypothetical protein
MMDDLLLLAGLGVFVCAGFLVAPLVGLLVLGAVLVLLSLAFRGVKIPRPSLKFRRRR